MNLRQLNYGSEVLYRNFNIDLLKLLACIAVVTMHTIHNGLSLFNTIVAYLCGFAVPVFYVSSGYFLMNKEKITQRYIVGKISSMIRVVLLWSAPVALFAEITKSALGRAENVSVAIIFRNSFCYPFFQKGYMGQFWYIGTMIILYLLLPILHKVIYGRKNRWVIIWVTFVLVSIGIQIGSLFVGAPLQKNVIQTCRLWTAIQYFLLGGGADYFVNWLRSRLTVRQHLVLLVAWTIFIAIYQVLVGQYIIHDNHPEFFYDDLWMIVWVVLLISFILRISLQKKLCQIINVLSPLTMGVYIFHPLVNKVGRYLLDIRTTSTAVFYSVTILGISFIAIHLFSKLSFSKYFLKF